MSEGPPIVTISRVDGTNVTTDENWIARAQFNPTSLQITHQAKNKTTSSSVGQQNGENKSGTLNQRTGIDVRLASVQLIFDTTREGTDVRDQTLKLVKFIMTEENGRKFAPTVQLQWGTLLLRGTIDSVSETLEYFSEYGKPMRATVKLQMTITAPEKASNRLGTGGGLSASAGLSAGFSAGFSAGVSASVGIDASANFSANTAVGTAGLTVTQSGESLQTLAARAGKDWKVVAEANGIDNPRVMQSGQIINMNADPNIKLTFNTQ